MHVNSIGPKKIIDHPTSTNFINPTPSTFKTITWLEIRSGLVRRFCPMIGHLKFQFSTLRPITCLFTSDYYLQPCIEKFPTKTLTRTFPDFPYISRRVRMLRDVADASPGDLVSVFQSSPTTIKLTISTGWNSIWMFTRKCSGSTESLSSPLPRTEEYSTTI